MHVETTLKKVQDGFLILQNKLKIISAEPIHYHCCITTFLCFLKNMDQ